MQRFILDQVETRGVISVPILARLHEDDDTRHLRYSIRRAATKLEAEGLVKLWDVNLPTRWASKDDGGLYGAIGLSYRWITCITTPDRTEWTDELDAEVRGIHTLMMIESPAH